MLGSNDGYTIPSFVADDISYTLPLYPSLCKCLFSIKINSLLGLLASGGTNDTTPSQVEI